MKTIIKTLMASTIAATAFAGVANAETTLTFSHWAGPKHAMATKVYPWLAEGLKECSGGSLTVKLENGLAPPPAQYDTVRDGVADERLQFLGRDVLVLGHARLNPSDDVDGGLDAHVGGDEGLFKRIEHLGRAHGVRGVEMGPPKGCKAADFRGPPVNLPTDPRLPEGGPPTAAPR